MSESSRDAVLSCKSSHSTASRGDVALSHSAATAQTGRESNSKHEYKAICIWCIRRMWLIFYLFCHEHERIIDVSCSISWKFTSDSMSKNAWYRIVISGIQSWAGNGVRHINLDNLYLTTMIETDNRDRHLVSNRILNRTAVVPIDFKRLNLRLSEPGIRLLSSDIPANHIRRSKLRY